MEHNAKGQLELVKVVLEDLDKRISSLHPLCSLSQSLPDIHTSHLKNLEIPLIHATKWISPGFFVQIEKLAKHITMHPCRGAYYLTTVLASLKTTEPECHASVTHGGDPTTIAELIYLLVMRYQQPCALEEQSIQVLRSNGRLADPTGSKRNFKSHYI